MQNFTLYPSQEVPCGGTESPTCTCADGSTFSPTDVEIPAFTKYQQQQQQCNVFMLSDINLILITVSEVRDGIFQFIQSNKNPCGAKVIPSLCACPDGTTYTAEQQANM